MLGKKAVYGRGRAYRVGKLEEGRGQRRRCPGAPAGGCKACVPSNNVGEGAEDTGARHSAKRRTRLGAVVAGELGRAGAGGGTARVCG